MSNDPQATDSQCSAPGAGRPASAVASREFLVSARVALFEADLALAMGNPGAARIQIDLAQAYLAEVSKGLRAPAAGYARYSLPAARS